MFSDFFSHTFVICLFGFFEEWFALQQVILNFFTLKAVELYLIILFDSRHGGCINHIIQVFFLLLLAIDKVSFKYLLNCKSQITIRYNHAFFNFGILNIYDKFIMDICFVFKVI